MPSTPITHAMTVDVEDYFHVAAFNKAIDPKTWDEWPCRVARNCDSTPHVSNGTTGITVTQFGWGGETAPGFLGRMNNDTQWFKPTVATTCYGMNDGGYKPFEKSTGDNYRKAQKAIVQQFKKWGVRTIIVGSPGCMWHCRHWPEL